MYSVVWPGTQRLSGTVDLIVVVFDVTTLRDFLFLILYDDALTSRPLLRFFFLGGFFLMRLYRALRGCSCGSRGFRRGPDDRHNHRQGATSSTSRVTSLQVLICFFPWRTHRRHLRPSRHACSLQRFDHQHEHAWVVVVLLPAWGARLAGVHVPDGVLYESVIPSDCNHKIAQNMQRINMQRALHYRVA